MSRVLAAVRKFFSKGEEPIRRKFYGYVGPLLALLVTRGYVTADDAEVISGVVGALLLIPFTEWARSSVAPFVYRPRATTAGRHRVKS